MAKRSIEFTAEVGGERRTFVISKITLGDMEDVEAASESGKMRDLLPVMARVLGITHAEIRQFEMEDLAALKRAMEQVSEAVTVPLESA